VLFEKVTVNNQQSIRGVKKGNLTFFLAAVFAILATLMILTSAAIWTAVVVKARAVNTQQIPVCLSLVVFCDDR
jgi:hypothetical protein